MANCSVRVEIDEAALKEAIKNGDGIESLLRSEAENIASRARSLSSGMRTGRFYDREKGQLLGDTEPTFASDVKKIGNGYVGIVYTSNYAAQKANYENNILLKAKG